MSLRILLILSLLGAIAVSMPAAAQEQTAQGQTPSGAFYRIRVPEGWEPADGLVIYNHGFDLGEVDAGVSLGPLVDVQLDQGYAVAASSYSLNGWALFGTERDLRELVDAFAEEFAEPQSIILWGGSLGGIVTAQGAEIEGLGNVVGAYALCPPLYGSRVWRAALDLRLSYDVVCDGVTGGEIPGGSGGLPIYLDPELIDSDVGDLGVGLVGAAVNICTGAELPASARTQGQQSRLDRLMQLGGLPNTDFFFLNMGYATFGLSDLYRDPRKLNEGNALGNVGVVYPDPEINDKIARIAPDPFAALNLRLNFTPTGRVGNTKVLTTHTDKDGLVFVEHQTEYLRRMPPENVVSAVVVEDTPSHCEYTEAEAVAGWNELRDWIATDQKPTVGGIQQTCEQLLALGVRGPCRYDPDFAAPGMETRIFPRAESEVQVMPNFAGQWYDPSQSGHGWFIEILDDERALVYWFSYPPTGDDGAQRWMGGVGTYTEDAIVVDDMFITSGARFGDAFDADDVQRDSWGSVRFVFDGCGSGRMRYSGPPAFGSGELVVDQLTYLGSGGCDDTPVSTPLSPALSGAWYQPERSGEGFLVQSQGDGRVFVIWFTYDDQGRQYWITGQATSVTGNGFTADLIATRGAAFGDDFRRAEVERFDWGSVTFTFSDCDSAEITYASDLEVFGSGSLSLQRLSRPIGLGDCG